MRYEKISLTNDESVYLEAFVADKVGDYKRKALLVIPGGGYAAVCSDREGEPIALGFIPYGYNAFVLHYTVARKRPFPAQLIEASLAIAHIKDHAEEYGIDPEKVFAVGFSAGGHLAGSLGTLWHKEEIYEATGMPYGYNKPRGVMLIYPVINAHIGSFLNLLCKDEPTKEELDSVSLDLNVDSRTTPTFIMHTVTDQIVNVSNAISMADALTKNGIPFEMHIYPDAPHGIALGNAITARGNAKHINPEIAKWIAQADAWAESI